MTQWKHYQRFFLGNRSFAVVSSSYCTVGGSPILDDRLACVCAAGRGAWPWETVHKKIFSPGACVPYGAGRGLRRCTSGWPAGRGRPRAHALARGPARGEAPGSAPSPASRPASWPEISVLIRADVVGDRLNFFCLCWGRMMMGVIKHFHLHPLAGKQIGNRICFLSFCRSVAPLAALVGELWQRSGRKGS